MRGLTMAAAAALLAAGCSGEAPAPEPEETETGELAAGLYDASWTVDGVRSTDKTDPATDLTQGATGTAQACVGEGGAIDPALFALAEDECTPSSSYVSGGRISMQLECQRPGVGRVMQSVNGTSTADGFEAEVSSTSYLSGPGDFEMTRTFTAKRVGECPAGGAAGDAAETVENATDAG